MAEAVDRPPGGDPGDVHDHVDAPVLGMDAVGEGADGIDVRDVEGVVGDDGVADHGGRRGERLAIDVGESEPGAAL